METVILNIGKIIKVTRIIFWNNLEYKLNFVLRKKYIVKNKKKNISISGYILFKIGMNIIILDINKKLMTKIGEKNNKSLFDLFWDFQ